MEYEIDPLLALKRKAESEGMTATEYIIPELAPDGYCENAANNTGVYPQFCRNRQRNVVYVRKNYHDRWVEIGDYDLLREAQQKEPEMSDVFKLLSTALIISSAEFARLTPAKQTEVLTSSSGKPVVFVPTFASLKNRNSIVKRLLAGEDVTMELEFNEVELTDDEKKLFASIKPVIDRLTEALSSGYVWVEPTTEEAAKIKKYRYASGYIYNDNTGYHIKEASAKKVWEKASKYWATGKKGDALKITVQYDNRSVTANDDGVKIGCQQISRAEVEAVALHFGWEPVTE